MKCLLCLIGMLCIAGTAIADGLACGFAISEQYVLTAYDVVGNQRAVQLKFDEGEFMSADFVEGDACEGWCLLKIPKDAPAFVSIESEPNVEAGDEVYAFGIGSEEGVGTGVSFHDGDVVAVSKNRSIVRHSIPLRASAMGGALFREDGNCAVGIVGVNRQHLGQAVQSALTLGAVAKKLDRYVGKRVKATRRSNRKAVCFIRTVGAEEPVSRRRRGSYNSSNDTNTESFKKSRAAVATIKAGNVSGTGFLCEMEGKKYFVTNRHVARQRDRMTAFFIDGTKMEFPLNSTIEVAENRDLVRFEVQSDSVALKLAESTPDIGERVEFFGNAAGGGVVTVTTGRILAVGQERIEIDCPIQGGNSGSPLVRVSDGCVIGVTAISTFNRLAGDLSKVGTRYDPNVKLTREFAVRFAGVTWKANTYGSYLRAINFSADLEFFYDWMKDVCGLHKNNSSFESQGMILEYRLADMKFTSALFLNNYIRKIAQCDEATKKACDRIVLMRAKNAEYGTMGRYSKTEMEFALDSLKNRMCESYRVRKDVLAKVVSHCKGAKFMTEDEKKIFVEAFDWQYRRYCEKYRLQLRGIFQEK